MGALRGGMSDNRWGKDVPGSEWSPELEARLRCMEEMNDITRGKVAALRELLRQRTSIDVIAHVLDTGLHNVRGEVSRAMALVVECLKTGRFD